MSSAPAPDRSSDRTGDEAEARSTRRRQRLGAVAVVAALLPIVGAWSWFMVDRGNQALAGVLVGVLGPNRTWQLTAAAGWVVIAVSALFLVYKAKSRPVRITVRTIASLMLFLAWLVAPIGSRFATGAEGAGAYARTLDLGVLCGAGLSIALWWAVFAIRRVMGVQYREYRAALAANGGDVDRTDLQFYTRMVEDNVSPPPRPPEITVPNTAADRYWALRAQRNAAARRRERIRSLWRKLRR